MKITKQITNENEKWPWAIYISNVEPPVSNSVTIRCWKSLLPDFNTPQRNEF
jgi:hypothetical protein